MTQQELQYAYFQRMRQQQLYRIYAAASSANSYDKIGTVEGTKWFLNYIEYDAKNITPDKANESLMTEQLQFSCGGMCTGVHKGNLHLRQLDWYYNEETEFIIRMKKCEEKGVKYSSIGVTASSPRLKWQDAKYHIENNVYNPYFDILPYLTVDGVNEKGIFAQSNVVMENGVDVININPQSSKHCCCSIMLVRFILDNVGRIDIENGHDHLREFLSTLHLYNAPREKIEYNNHVLVADAHGNTRIIEFEKDGFEIVDVYPVMTNFRMTGLSTIGEGPNISADWQSVEYNGIGVERWEYGMRFVNDGNVATLDDFKILRNNLNYTHAYDRNPAVCLTDNLSGDYLSVMDAFGYHHDTISPERKALFDTVLSTYEDMFKNRDRTKGNLTWITTHGAIYDLQNISCNIQTQQETCWNVLSDGTITPDYMVV